MMPARGGIHTFLNGALVYKDGVYTGAMPDQVRHSQ
jgi:hypothetical protein